MQDKIKKVISLILEAPIDSINENFSTESTEQWDSLTHIKLVLALEEEFDIRLEEDDIVNAISYKNIVSIVDTLTS